MRPTSNPRYDTTSRLFGFSKAAALRKIRDDEALKSQVRVFLTQSTKAWVIESGEHLVSALYGGDRQHRLPLASIF